MLAAFIVPLLAGSWRASLVLWSIPLVAIALIIFLFQPGGKDAPVSRHRLWMPDWRDPLLWKLGLIMSAPNQLYFCTNAFLPGYLLHTDRTDLIGPALTALNVGQLPASFLLLVMASRWERRKWPLLSAAALGIAGIAGILVSGHAWSLIGSAAMIGFACAITLTLVLALPALLVAPDDVPRMSAGIFTMGYGLAMTISADPAMGTAALNTVSAARHKLGLHTILGCDSMKRNTPGLPVHHQLPESTQTHVHQVGDAIQPSRDQYMVAT